MNSWDDCMSDMELAIQGLQQAHASRVRQLQKALEEADDALAAAADDTKEAVEAATEGSEHYRMLLRQYLHHTCPVAQRETVLAELLEWVNA